MSTYPEFLVRIHCMTYNHAPYIEDAMNGFCMQQTTFPFVATIIDDASTDGEPEVIRRYLDAHFDLSEKGLSRQWETDDAYFIYAQHRENKNCYFAIVLLKYNFWQAKKSKEPLIKDWTNTKYVAFCEGDDYWVDSEKIQRQVDFLEGNEDYSTVTENSIVKNTIYGKQHLFSDLPERDVTIEEMVERRRFATASVMSRNVYDDEGYKALKVKYDTMIWCYLATKGKIKYLEFVSSVYVRGKQGITEYTPPYIWAKQVELWNSYLKLYFGHLYDTKISDNHVYAHYETIVYRSIYNCTYNIIFYKCLWKCIIKKPIYTIKRISKYYLGSLYSYLYNLTKLISKRYDKRTH